MKFVVLFVVCCVALATADDQQSLNQVRKIVQDLTEQVKPDCANLKKSCEKIAAVFHGDDKVVASCVSIADQVCKGEAVTDVYKRVLEFGKRGASK